MVINMLDKLKKIFEDLFEQETYETRLKKYLANKAIYEDNDLHYWLKRFHSENRYY